MKDNDPPDLDHGYKNLPACASSCVIDCRYSANGPHWNFGTLNVNLTCPESADGAFAGRLEVFKSVNYAKHCEPGSLYHSLQIGCVATNLNASWFFTYPAKFFAVYMWTFSRGGLSFALNPVALQRMFIARSERACASALSLVHSYPLVICVPLIFLGILVATIQPDCLEKEQIDKTTEYCSTIGCK